MKINILMPDIVRTPAGGHKVIYDYSNRLAEDGYDVALYFFPGGIFSKFHFPERLRLQIVKIYGDTINPVWFKLDKRIKKKVVIHADEMRSADVVLATGVNTAFPVYELPEKYGKKGYFIQGFENWDYSDDYVYNTYNLGMRNMVVSKWLQKKVNEHTNIPCELISNGVDEKVFFKRKGQPLKHSIVFQYRSQAHKGCKYGIKAIHILEKKYPDLKVIAISSEVKPSNFPQNWKYKFNVSSEKVAEINNQSEVFICSTIDEGFGLPGLEAMACGCAVASTDYTGVHDYAIDGVNALLSPVRDAKALADNVIKLFENDALREKIVHAGIETGKERTVQNSYKKFKHTLEDMVKR